MTSTLVQRRRFFQAAGATAAAAALPSLAMASDVRGSVRAGKVFTSTNGAAGNEVLVIDPDAAGGPQLVQRIATQGTGTSRGLGSQDAVRLSGSGRWLFVVNAGSHSVSTFRVGAQGLELASVVPSGGLTPTSVTEADGRVYVLNAGGSGNVAGFSNEGGQLVAIPGSVQGLSAAGGTAPAQVGLSDGADTLIVTERATNLVVTYRVNADGSLASAVAHPSAGLTPFGFALDKRGTVLVSEAFGGAANASTMSSYRFAAGAPQTPAVISAAVPTQQTAACWVAITPNGRWAYTTNTGSGSISLYAIAPDGRIGLVQAIAAATAGSGPIDASVSNDGRALHVLQGPLGRIASYRIASDGTLASAGGFAGLPAGSVGLAAN